MKPSRSPLRHVVFLDIDGVLQPTSSQHRFEHDLDILRDRLATEVDTGYRALDKYDIGAVRYDWHDGAVRNLKTLCQQAGASVVVSSSWREGKTLEVLRMLFWIHDLDKLIVDKTAELGARDLEIEEFLVAHRETKRFVVLDDGYRWALAPRFPRQFVETRDHFDDAALDKARAVLRRPTVKRDRARLERFDALLRRDPALTEVSFDIEDIGIIRRKRGYSAQRFLELLGDAAATCPNLHALTVRGLVRDFERDWDKKKDDPVAWLERTARKNPALTELDLRDIVNAF